MDEYREHADHLECLARLGAVLVGWSVLAGIVYVCSPAGRTRGLGVACLSWLFYVVNKRGSVYEFARQWRAQVRRWIVSLAESIERGQPVGQRWMGEHKTEDRPPGELAPVTVFANSLEHRAACLRGDEPRGTLVGGVFQPPVDRSQDGRGEQVAAIAVRQHGHERQP